MPSHYIDFTLTSDQNYFATVSYALFQLISSSMNIQNMCSISDQNSVLNQFLSDVAISNSVISNIEMIEPSFIVTSSLLNISQSTISLISSPDSHDLMFITLDSSLIIDNLVFEDSLSNLFNSLNTDIQIDTLMLRNISSSLNLLKISTSQYVNISNYQTENAATSASTEILITSSNNVKIENVNVSDVPQIVLEISNSIVDYLINFQVHRTMKAINILNSNVNMITGNFTQNGDSLQYKGGAIYIENSVVFIENSEFVNNTANDGGAIDLSCTSVVN